ncbi:hypothetical protein CGRA01v4_05161 [Colletotrichum graminicola]|nr:hypothetical protein CGRA01v4_05161 [Colletotrichum graminicola]
MIHHPSYTDKTIPPLTNNPNPREQGRPWSSETPSWTFRVHISQVRPWARIYGSLPLPFLRGKPTSIGRGEPGYHQSSLSLPSVPVAAYRSPRIPEL